MRISAKGRYALASAIIMSQNYYNGEHITVISISEKLGISKIYLEQVFSLLKRGGLVSSIKGAQGGYQLTRMPEQITVYDVLSAVEFSVFEKIENTLFQYTPEIETAMRLSAFNILDNVIENTLKNISLKDLTTEAEKHKSEQELMFFI